MNFRPLRGHPGVGFSSVMGGGRELGQEEINWVPGRGKLRQERAVDTHTPQYPMKAPDTGATGRKWPHLKDATPQSRLTAVRW